MPARKDLIMALGVCVLCHGALASVTTYVLMRRLKLITWQHAPMWFLSSFFLGYPVWFQVTALKRANAHGRMKKL
jgi:hypothetical protein